VFGSSRFVQSEAKLSLKELNLTAEHLVLRLYLDVELETNHDLPKLHHILKATTVLTFLLREFLFYSDLSRH